MQCAHHRAAPRQPRRFRAVGTVSALHFGDGRRGFHDLRQLGRAQLSRTSRSPPMACDCPDEQGRSLICGSLGWRSSGSPFRPSSAFGSPRPWCFRPWPPAPDGDVSVPAAERPPRAVMIGHGCGVVAGLTAVTVLRQSHQTGVLDQPTWMHGVAAALRHLVHRPDGHRGGVVHPRCPQRS